MLYECGIESDRTLTIIQDYNKGLMINFNIKVYTDTGFESWGCYLPSHYTIKQLKMFCTESFYYEESEFEIIGEGVNDNTVLIDTLIMADVDSLDDLLESYIEVSMMVGKGIKMRDSDIKIKRL